MASSASRGVLSREMYIHNSTVSSKNILKEISTRLNGDKQEHPEERNLWRLGDFFYMLEGFLYEEYLSNPYD